MLNDGGNIRITNLIIEHWLPNPGWLMTSSGIVLTVTKTYIAVWISQSINGESFSTNKAPDNIVCYS